MSRNVGLPRSGEQRAHVGLKSSMFLHNDGWTKWRWRVPVGVSAAFPERPRRSPESAQSGKKRQRRKEVRQVRKALLFLLLNMRCETDPIEPGYVSIECPVFAFPFNRLADVRLTAGNDPLCLGTLEGTPFGFVSGPDGQCEAPRLVARGACTHRNIVITKTRTTKHGRKCLAALTFSEGCLIIIVTSQKNNLHKRVPDDVTTEGHTYSGHPCPPSPSPGSRRPRLPLTATFLHLLPQMCSVTCCLSRQRTQDQDHETRPEGPC